MRALMAELISPPVLFLTETWTGSTSESIAPPPDAEGVVYPVWFGTNRRPSATGDGFTGERHDRVTGRVEVFVPEAHRFGETGKAF